MNNNTKILKIENLVKVISVLKKNKKNIVQCHGVFDLIHLGHIRHFQEAKKNSEILIVTVTSDKFIKKGPNRPYYKINQRLEMLSNLNIVDYVIENNSPDAVNIIKKIKPDYYCKGIEYKNHKKDITKKIKDEISAINSVKGKIIYTNDIVFSSSSILNSFDLTLTKDQKNILSIIKKNTNFENIKKQIDNFKNTKVLIVGETIIDKYVFCEAVGKSGKEPVLVLREINEDSYLGGAAIVANHLSDFCKKITLVSMLGEKKELSNFVNNNLKNNIKTNFILKKDSPTIVKKRFVDSISGNKTLGVYSLNDKELNINQEKKLQEILRKEISKHDIVIVCDYGHGFISKNIAKKINNTNKYFALNAQINSTNIGHHTIDKYKNIDCLVINESEIRHEFRDRTSDIDILLKNISKKLKVKNSVVTQGSDGASYYNAMLKKFNKIPAFANTVVDKVGAGDAMLAFYSICLKNKLNNNLSLLLSSLAAAQSVETIGNSQYVSKVKILKDLQHLLK
ncbi:PfkB family carbohydrate kinase [Alphaproteobacteria bacterium]|nr:PfkB family carbohydrate kinase [Alphaproteobacteria bacterium]